MPSSLCAAAPEASPAAGAPPDPARRPPGALLYSTGPRHGGRVFYCDQGMRHWILHPEWLEEHGCEWSELRAVEDRTLDAFRRGRDLPGRWSEADRAHPPFTDAPRLRELLCAPLRGEGVEFGAGTQPLPIPFECRVRYADLLGIEGLRRESYEGQEAADFIVPDLQASLERLEGIAPESLDFIAACHVIEHTTDPIGALVRSAARLRPGGHIALVVPDKERTFDRARPTTPLDHLIADYESPSRERDQLDFQEFYRLAQPAPDWAYEQIWHERWERAYPIHYHTWTHASFLAMVEWIRARTGLFSAVWSHHPPPDGGAIEFYVLLTR